MALFHRGGQQVIERHAFRVAILAGAAPILVIIPRANESKKAGFAPVVNTANQTVSNGIVMDVIDVAFEGGLIANGVLPVSWLEDTSAAVAQFAWRHPLFHPTKGDSAFCELLFDPSPTLGIGMIAMRQSLDRMKMVGQQDDRARMERPLRTCLAKNFSKQGFRCGILKDRCSTLGDYGEEVTAASDLSTTIIGHCNFLVAKISAGTAGPTAFGSAGSWCV